MWMLILVAALKISHVPLKFETKGDCEVTRESMVGAFPVLKDQLVCARDA